MMRPRDAIMYLNACVRDATGKNRITWANIHGAERAYSHERLAALIDEWKYPYADIGEALKQFRRQPECLNRDQFNQVAENIFLLLADDKFSGTHWLEPMAQWYWSPGSNDISWEDGYGSLLDLLYKIGFIGITKGMGSKPTFSYETGAFHRALDLLRDNSSFEVQRAFRPALELRTSRD